MKKLTLVLALVGIIFVSCKQETNLTKDYPDGEAVDTTKVDTTKVDSTKVDSTTVDSVTNK
jgi:PBP1b-binding outer membrane lipoprotein LpoB